MSEKRYPVVTIADLKRPDGWSPIRRELGVSAFGINGWTAGEAGGTIIPDHDETPSGHEELYVVFSGRATFTVDGDEIDAPPGTVVFVRDPDSKRVAVAAEPDTTVLAVGAKPREAYRPRPWETNADVLPLFEQGRYEDVKRILLDGLDRYEDKGTLLFNLACAEAQLGEVDPALEHLAAALEADPSLAENTRGDTDLDPLRGDPRFPAV